MRNVDTNSSYFSKIRLKAEELFKKKKRKSYSSLLELDTEKLINESCINKIELELLKKELLLTQKKITTNKNSELLEQITDDIPAILAIINKKLEYIFVNKAYEVFFGLNKNQIIGKKAKDIIGVKSYSKAHPYFLKALDGATVNFENQILDKDGVERFIHTSYKPYYEDNEIVGVIALIIDISESKTIQEALYSSNENFRKVFNSHPGAAGISTITEGKYINVNNRFTEMFGWKKEEVIGKTSQELGLFKNYDQRREILDLIIKNQRVTNYEVELISKNGNVHNVIFNAEIIELKEEKNLLVQVYDITERKKIEEQLKENEEKYRTLFENAPVGIFHSSIDGRFLEANPALAKMLGYSSTEELLFKTQYKIDKIYHNPKERKKIIRELANHDGWKQYNELIWRADGNKIAISMMIRKVLNPEGKFDYMEGFVEDISSRKQAEEALSENEEKYRTLLEFAPEAFFQGNKNGNFITVNDKAIELTGFSREELHLMNMSDIFTDCKLKENPLRYDMLDEGMTRRTERDLKRKNGEVVLVEMISKKMQDGTYQSFMSDISERKKNEIALMESEAQLKLIFDVSPDALFLVGKDAKFIKVNDFATNKYGYSREEFLNLTPFNLASPKLLEKVPLQIKTMQFSEHYFEWFHCTKEGKEFPVEIHSKPIKIGERNYVFVNVRDISERKQTEEKLIQLNEHLSKLNATKDKLFTLIGHDLKSPFISILGYSERLNNNIQSYDFKKAEEYSGYINASAKHTLVLVENLLDWAKTQSGQIRFKPENLYLKSIIQETVEILISSAKTKNISINSFQSDTIVINADLNMLRAILRNLLSNAIKFTRFNGKINIYALKDNENIKISIEDNGVGMDEETQSNLFKIGANISTWGTADEKGSGLGLLICKEFIEKHGGKIWVESNPEIGSKFHFTIPNNI